QSDEFANANGRHHPNYATQKSQRHRFKQELTGDISPPGAEGFANSNLGRTLSDAYQHDVHHTDPAHHQAHRGNRNRDHADHAEDAVELRDESVRSLYSEVVRLR